MTYKALIFDFDYTLADATVGIVAAFNYALEMMGHEPAAVEAIRKTVGHTLEFAYQTITADYEDENQRKFRGHFSNKADEAMIPGTKLLPYAVELLDYAKETKTKTAIVSSKNSERILGSFEALGVREPVSLVIGFNDVKIPKPDPEGLLVAIDRLNIKKEECLYIGDSVIDAETAHNAGVDFAGVLTGTSTAEDLIKFKNVGIFANLKELKDWLTQKS